VDPRLAGIELSHGWVPALVDLVAIALVALALVGRPRRRVVLAVAGAAVGVVVGLLICWLVTDVIDPFGVSLSPMSRAWVAAAFGGVGSVIAAVGRGPRIRRVAAGFAIPAVLLAGAFGVNADFGQYPTIGSLTGRPVAPPLPASLLTLQALGAPGIHLTDTHHATALWARSTSASMPRHGVVGTVSIPGTQSRFPARPAYLYLPPAALVPHPVALPVLVLLSGQPGAPANAIESGQVARIFDAFAAAHHGLAPIVVIPDQLSAPQVNPMCVDSSIGNSASYLLVDVPRWIRTHLTVQVTPDAWAIGGYSQGGTCSLQLSVAHPELFGGMVDMCGEIAPSNGDLAHTIATGFAGKRSSYEAALPLHIIAGKHFRNSLAILGSGQFDTVYGPPDVALSAALRASGVRVSLVTSPGTSHDWHTVQWILRTQLDPLYRQFGLERG
jgi:enterochelin esterase-like enzyme